MTRRLRYRLALAAVVPAVGFGVVGLGGLHSWAQVQGGSGGCSSYSTFTALGEAEGVQTLQSAPGATLVDTGDAELPGAQANFDSLVGSTGWAGAPFSQTVAGNAAASTSAPGGGVTANQVPTFAVSSYPANPKASNSSIPGASVQASSGAQSSSAKAVSGIPSSGQATFGQATASASATCGDDGSLHGVADSQTDLFDIGVLSIGQVTSHADALMDPTTGEPTLNGSMSVAGATVAGQPVAITDQGVEVAGSPTALPGNPAQQALASAGITVQYLAATKDPKTGTVFAPGLQIETTQLTPGVGGGSVVSEFLLGRAMAVASLSGSLPDQGGAGAGSTDTSASSLDTSSAPSTDTGSGSPAAAVTSSPTGQGVSSVAATPTAPTVSSPARPGTSSPGQRLLPVAHLANASSAGVYGALGAGMLLLMATVFVFGIVGRKLQWR